MTSEQYEAKIKNLEDRLTETTEQATNLYRMLYNLVVHCGPEIRIKMAALFLPHIGTVAMRTEQDEIVVHLDYSTRKVGPDGSFCV